MMTLPMPIEHYFPIFAAIGLGILTLILYFTVVKYLEIRRIRQNTDKFDRTKIFTESTNDKMYRAFFKNTGSAAVITNNEGCIISLNYAFQEEYNFENHRMKGKHVHSIVSNFHELEEGKVEVEIAGMTANGLLVKLECFKTDGSLIEGWALII